MEEKQGGAVRLSELEDVDIQTVEPVDANVLQYEAASGKWVPGAGAANLDDLADVVAVDPNNNDVLAWSDTSGAWISQAMIPTYTAEAGHAANADYATNAGAVDGIDSSAIIYGVNPNKTNGPIGSFDTTLASGFYDALSPTGTPVSGWNRLIVARHNNVANDYQVQLANPFGSQKLYLRNISAGTRTAWGALSAEAGFTMGVDGAGAVIPTGAMNSYFEFPYDLNIQYITILCFPAATLNVAAYKCTYATYPTWTLVGNAGMSAATKIAYGPVGTEWSATKGDIWYLNLTANNAAQRLSICFKGYKD